jgi:DNA polymerase-3 subunit alpha
MSNGFHTHTMYGSLDSPASATDLINRSLELGRNSLTITDHGGMHALPEFWRVNEGFKKKGKPHLQIIHGIEPYITFDELSPKDYGKYFHMTVLFKSEEAFRWFSSKSLEADNRSVTVFEDKKPLYKFEWLRDIAGEIVVGSGCLKGVVQQLFLKGNPELAEQYYLMMKDVFGDENFFVELMPHKLDQTWVKPKMVNKAVVQEGYFKQNDFDLQAAPNRFLYDLAKKHGDKMIISEDAHLATQEQKVIQDILLGNGKDCWRFSVAYSMEDPSFWAKTLYEHTGCTEDDIHEMVENSYKVADLCSGYKFSTSDDKIYLPNMEMIFGEDKPTLKTLIEEIKKNGLLPRDPDEYQKYTNRLKLEIDVLTNNGVADFIPYILLAYDVVKTFREKKGFITPRGSAGGSLILYLLGISIADPIKYNLSFARFLTKGRIAEGNFPDIDLDCADQKSVFDFLKDKYKDCFCQVCTETAMKIKTSMKDVECSICSTS